MLLPYFSCFPFSAERAGRQFSRLTAGERFENSDAVIQKPPARSWPANGYRLSSRPKLAIEAA
jgi:hypothetical protein